jgi:hypothetical protein
MRPGGAAEFDTQLPRWFGPAGDELVEILSVHGSRSADARPRSAAPHAPAGLNIPAPDREPPRGATPEDGNRAWRPHFAAGPSPGPRDERDPGQGEEPLLRRWERGGRDNWGVRSRLGLRLHRALPERIGDSRLKPQIVQ